MREAIEAIQAAGFNAYLPTLRDGREPTWAYFTDGTRIGYIQRDGFGNATWSMSPQEQGNVVKWANWERFQAANAWAKYVLVAEKVEA